MTSSSTNPLRRFTTKAKYQLAGLAIDELQLELDTNGPMSPRQAINSAPFSQMAGVAESVE